MNTQILRRSFLSTVFALSAMTAFGADNENSKVAEVTGLKRHGQRVDYRFEGLVDKDGRPLLQTDIAGQNIAIYGGYLECIGVCPGAANSIVDGALRLKKEHPELVENTKFIVVMIKNNNPDETIEQSRARADKWQSEGLQGDQTGIKVYVSDDQAVLERFKDALGIEIAAGKDGALNHSGLVYLFDQNGIYKDVLRTQKGSDVFYGDLMNALGVSKPTVILTPTR